MKPWQWLFGVSLAIAGVTRARAACAQAITVVDSINNKCSYQVCALTIAPRWNGLAVVRGASGPTVANLGFFLPHDITAALGVDDHRAIGSDSVAAAAKSAIHLRRVGATLTDTGLAVMIVAGIRATFSASNKRLDAVAAGAGAALLGFSVPFQFAADGALSRAVWWHNLRYARTLPASP